MLGMSIEKGSEDKTRRGRSSAQDFSVPQVGKRVWKVPGEMSLKMGFW